MCTDFAARVGRKALWHPVYGHPPALQFVGFLFLDIHILELSINITKSLVTKLLNRLCDVYPCLV